MFDILNPTGYQAPPVRVMVSGKTAYAQKSRLVQCASSMAHKGRVDESVAAGAGFAPVTAGARPDFDPLDRLAYTKGVGTIVRTPEAWRKA